MTNDDTGLGDLGARRVLAATAAPIIPVLISKDEIENGPQNSLKKIPGGLQIGSFFL